MKDSFTVRFYLPENLDVQLDIDQSTRGSIILGLRSGGVIGLVDNKTKQEFYIPVDRIRFVRFTPLESDEKN